ncbi:MAG: SagB/ThcOx family dehydrogenase [Acidiferrobacterales bacterium]
MFELPVPSLDGNISVEDAVNKRRSVREFTDQSLSIAELSQCVWSAQGVTGADGKKVAPSAGALYPVALYVVIGAVDNLSAGLYRYEPSRHRLEAIRAGELRTRLRDAALEEQPWIAQAASILVIAADMGKASSTFQQQPPAGQRGFRYVYMETGAIAENVYLQGQAIGVGVVFIGGFDDQKVMDVLKLPSPYTPVGLVCLGRAP